MDESIALFGRAIIVAGFAPALIWFTLNILLFAERLVPGFAPGHILLEPEGLAIIVALSALVGVVLTALNTAIIRLYEGAYPFQRRWLFRRALQHNQEQHERHYHRLLDLRQMHQEALRQPESGDHVSRRADSALLALDQAHRDLEQQGIRLPLRANHIMPTALGNAYAVMEEYPFDRYGMDSQIFWPRLLMVLDADHRVSVGEQKTTCDFLLNMSLLLTILFLESVVVALLALPQPAATISDLWLPLVAIPLSLLLAYGAYRAAVSETWVLARLITATFDLHRHKLLRHFGVEPPARLADERPIWLSLAAFIRRGEAFYYPQ